jgi:hypothetical protein
VFALNFLYSGKLQRNLPFNEDLVANAALPQLFYFAFYVFLLLKAEFVEI